MKVFDEKGKLFGKINIVDLLVLVLIIAAAAVLVVKFTGRNTGGGANTTLTYTVRVMEVTQESYENVCQFVNKEAGIKDQLQASGKLLPGYIVDVSATPHIPTPSDTVGGDTLDLLFTLEVSVSDPVANAVGTQEVRIGKPHIVKGVHVEFEKGMVMTCQWSS